jgi:hypothetical protein
MKFKEAHLVVLVLPIYVVRLDDTIYKDFVNSPGHWVTRTLNGQ